MSLTITATDRYGAPCSVNIDSYASQCPVCHLRIEPIRIGAFLNSRGNESPALQIVQRCPSAGCGMIFLALYRGVIQTGTVGLRYYFFERAEPWYPADPQVPESLKTLSPSFVKIYTEATAADQWGLKEICGAGFRKALEFLVKDFIISVRPSEKEAIAKLPLATCIETYIKDPMTKAIAKRATWLGNDETHYYRKTCLI